ncbi:MAG: tRNA (guanine(10)-N(2))-dimethyltransferase [Metallosphaera sp.]|uniref:tRNA (guanine(10)-N(2))-dimethyltransferase n=1 Tax=Metallosphaera cuprina TaxID=1006005 RepID=UPI00064F2EBA|nr:tRNA (guanine(10)-N(2))-dimethyltransferase [Metallosphaera cuprina]
MRLTEITEGKAKILIPDPVEFSREGKFDPAWSPVFYNPRMVFNRDVSVLAVSVISPSSVLDAMAATGIRGIRFVLEGGVNGEVIFNDKNPVAIELISKNIELNRITNYKIMRADANSIMHQLKVDYTDLDPFGSPAPFLFAALSSLRRKGVLGVTATDLSALEGKSITACNRKYGASGKRLNYSKEAGLRVLLAKIAREAAVQEKGILPLISFYKDYYYRLFVKTVDGAKRADKALEQIGMLYECQNCGFSFMDKECQVKCPMCGGEVNAYGPAWIGKLNSIDFLNRMKERLDKAPQINNPNSVKRLLDSLISENGMGPYYRIDVLASKLKVNMPPTHRLIDCLEDGTRTHFDERGIKTSKSFDQLIECMKNLA